MGLVITQIGAFSASVALAQPSGASQLESPDLRGGDPRTSGAIIRALPAVAFRGGFVRTQLATQLKNQGLHVMVIT
jgi:hypothetical protein